MKFSRHLVTHFTHILKNPRFVLFLNRIKFSQIDSLTPKKIYESQTLISYFTAADKGGRKICFFDQTFVAKKKRINSLWMAFSTYYTTE